MARKTRAINKSRNDKNKIIELSEDEKSPAEIEKYFAGKYTYWQIYNTINPRSVKKKSEEEEKQTEDSIITNTATIDLDKFGSIEKYLEHQVTVLLTQLESKNLNIERRTKLLKELTVINQKVKAQQIEQHLKDANAKLVIRIMRRLQPELSDENLLKIYREEVEKLKAE